ncbi:MAG: LysR family transcriptional regulator [Acidobacteriota bacterium]|jgi:DNA-binding transcriptional LysR family regulator
MEIRQLKAFIAIAETKTFTAGAKRMNVTQAAISMQIRQLEQEVGVPLFVRTPRKAVLTEAGEHLIGRARNILREHDAAVAEIAELAGSEHGRLRIGSASAAFSIEQLPVILEKLKKKFSNAEISVSSGTSQALVEKIIHGEIDVAFVSLPVEAANIHTELLFSDEILAIAHPSHRLAGESVVSAADLAREPLILGEKGGNTRRMIDEFFQQSNVKPRVVMELSRQSAINRMVENGLGVGIAGAKGIAKAVGEKRLVSWMIEGSEIRWELGLAWIRGGYRSPIEKEFTLLCQSIFKNK